MDAESETSATNPHGNWKLAPRPGPGITTSAQWTRTPRENRTRGTPEELLDLIGAKDKEVAGAVAALRAYRLASSKPECKPAT